MSFKKYYFKYIILLLYLRLQGVIEKRRKKAELLSRLNRWSLRSARSVHEKANTDKMSQCP